MKRTEQLRLALGLELLAARIRVGPDSEDLVRLAEISASHDLLVALESMLAFALRLGAQEETSVTIGTARAAIAKARTP